MSRPRPLLLLAVLVAGCGKGSTDHWIEQLKAGDDKARIRAVRTLMERQEEAGQVVPALAGALQDPDVYVRRDAARALGRFGGQAAEAVPALVAALRDRAPSVRKAAGDALKKVDPSAAARAKVR